jgi:hypothetical protein
MWIDTRNELIAVVAGLDPAIHLLAKRKRMDPRVKPAGDRRDC